MGAPPSQGIKETLVGIVDHLSPVQRLQLLDFARLLQQQALEHPPSCEERAGETSAPAPKIQLNQVPATNMIGLTGLASLGGDAVADTEALYNGNGRA